jgi:hypothetical protein
MLLPNYWKTNYGILRIRLPLLFHGTHLVKHTDMEDLKEKYKLSKRKIISTLVY